MDDTRAIGLLDYTIGSLFTGIAGIDRGLEGLGLGPVVWQAENDPAATRVLAQHYPRVRQYRDVKEIDETATRPSIICGGFPCQDISVAGKGAGIDGERSGLWAEFARIIRALCPDFVFVENVPPLVKRGLDQVLQDLAEVGLDAVWDCYRAADVGAPHRRERFFLLAYSDRERVRLLAERLQRHRGGVRAAERQHAEPSHDRAALAHPDGGGQQPGERELRAGKSDADRRGGGQADVAYAAIGGREAWSGERGSGGTAAGEVGGGLAQPGRRSDQAGDVADADGAGWGSEAEPPVAGAGGDPDRHAREAEPGRRGPGLRGSVALADADRGRREGGGLAQPGGVEGSPGGLADGRGHLGYVHTFPPGPAGIAEWAGPQPAVRRGDARLPAGLDRGWRTKNGIPDRLRLLGNACVPQQAALAFVSLVLRAAAL